MPRAFVIGSLLYPAIEVLWRGRTHPAMSLAGGVSLSGLEWLSRKQKHRPLWQQALLGGVMITGIEFAFGKAFNRRYRIWDYRKQPLNVQGQICAPYTLAWCALSAAGLMLLRALPKHSS